MVVSLVGYDNDDNEDEDDEDDDAIVCSHRVCLSRQHVYKPLRGRLATSGPLSSTWFDDIDFNYDRAWTHSSRSLSRTTM
jgi:hypothetical protein